MLRSMYSGISGMKNFQTKLDVIGNNIANVSTFGFKKGRVTFKDTMNQVISGASAATADRGGKNATQVGLGSTLATIDTVHTGSSLQTTGRSLDLGIDGDGYFVVNNGGANLFTRSGNFYLDNYGSLVTGDGLKVQAFKADGTLGEVSVNVNAVQPAMKTSEIVFSGNLSSGTIANNSENIYTQQVKIIDPNGKPIRIDVNFYKIGEGEDNTWEVYINEDPTDDDINPVEISFDEDGLITEGEPIEFEFAYDPDEDPMTINLNFAGLIQGAETTTALVAPNGNEQGKLESYNIGNLGEINGVYSNGQIVNIRSTCAC